MNNLKSLTIGIMTLMMVACNTETPETEVDTLSEISSSQSSSVREMSDSSIEIRIASSAPTEKTFTLEDVAQHNTRESCYTAIEGNVYDITPYIPFHKGGERDIMKICGIDGSTLFGNQHGEDPEPNHQIDQFYIGILVE